MQNPITSFNFILKKLITFFPRRGKDLSQIYNRLAKEGAKLNLDISMQHKK